MHFMAEIDFLAWLFGLFCIAMVSTVVMSGKRKTSTKDAERVRRNGHEDWVMRGGTHEGWLNQNAEILPRGSRWKAGR